MTDNELQTPRKPSKLMLILACLFFGAVGFFGGSFGGFFIGALLAPVFNVTDFEGASGYFALLWAMVFCGIETVAGIVIPIIVYTKKCRKALSGER